MNEMADRFASLERTLAEEKGAFELFALFLRDGAPDRWDLLISAPWLPSDRIEALDYIVARIKEHLGADALIRLSRIVIVRPEDLAKHPLSDVYSVEHGQLEVRDTQLFGLPIKHAFIITSQKLEAPAVR